MSSSLDRFRQSSMEALTRVTGLNKRPPFFEVGLKMRLYALVRVVT